MWRSQKLTRRNSSATNRGTVCLWIAVVGAIKPQPPKVKRHRAPTRPASAGLSLVFAVGFPLRVGADDFLTRRLRALIRRDRPCTADR